jgi:glycosyltransferase involved in cell wall biosynthesis
MLTIGFDAKRLYQNFTGLGNYSRSLVSDLQRFYPENDYHLYSPGIKKRPSTLPFLENSSFRNHIYTGVLGSWWRTYGMVKDLKKDKLDIYHGLSHELPEGIDRLPIRSVVTMHDMVIKKHPDLFPWMDRKIYDKKFASACARADQIIAISESTKNDVIEAYGVEASRIKTVYQTCDPIFWQTYSKELVDQVLSKYDLPKEYLLYVGSVIERKNLLNLAKAVGKLPKGIAMPLVVVGEGKKYFDKVKAWVKENGLLDNLYLSSRPLLNCQ